MGPLDMVNQNGAPLCHVYGCRKHKRLHSRYDGLFCAGHVCVLATIYERIHDRNLSQKQQLEARLEEQRLLKRPNQRIVSDLLKQLGLPGMPPRLEEEKEECQQTVKTVDHEAHQASPFDMIHHDGSPLCHVFRCRQYRGLVSAFGGLFCYKHLKMMAKFHDQITNPAVPLKQQLEARLEVQRLIKCPNQRVVNILLEQLGLSEMPPRPSSESEISPIDMMNQDGEPLCHAFRCCKGGRKLVAAFGGWFCPMHFNMISEIRQRITDPSVSLYEQLEARLEEQRFRKWPDERHVIHILNQLRDMSRREAFWTVGELAHTHGGRLVTQSRCNGLVADSMASYSPYELVQPTMETRQGSGSTVD